MRNGKQSSKYLVGNPFAVLVGLSCVLATALPAARADDDARAHAIAERFAGASDEAKKRAETERLQAIKAAAEAKRKSEDAKRRADAERKKTEQMRADEADMLNRARMPVLLLGGDLRDAWRPLVALWLGSTRS